MALPVHLDLLLVQQFQGHLLELLLSFLPLRGKLALKRVRKSNSLSPAYDPICLFYELALRVKERTSVPEARSISEIQSQLLL